jgi:hypothetical protein
VQIAIRSSLILLLGCSGGTSTTTDAGTDAARPMTDSGGCGSGFRMMGSSCVDLDECMPTSPCDANATCTNTDGSYMCACNDFYSGDGNVCTLDAGAVDQFYTGEFIGTLYVTPRQHIGQTFTVGRSGLLVGLDFELTRRDAPNAAFNAIVAIFDQTGAMRAMHTIADSVPAIDHQSLSMTANSPVYLDLSGDGLMVTAGQQWSFLVSASSGGDTCMRSVGTCMARQQGCSIDADCGGEYSIAFSMGDGYAGGQMLCPGTCGPTGMDLTRDVYFKTVVISR